MPKIATSKLVEHRTWRRNQLIEAAAAIAIESGSSAITVTAVAERAGMSRTSVYEYFASTEELVADLIIDELNNYVSVLSSAISEDASPWLAIEQWLRAALTYIADGRHLIAKSLNAAALPKERAAEIGIAHRALLAPLRKSLGELGVSDIDRALALIQSASDVATKRIESGKEAEDEIVATIAFCLSGITALTSGLE